MTVFSKLQKARLALVNSSLKKSGKNKFAGYEYFELGDFMPTIHKLFDEIGLCGVFTLRETQTFLTIHDTEVDGGSVVFATPTVMASNPKGQAIQDLGSTHTYLRRYLWLMAMEIVEHDTVDAIPQDQERLNKPKAEKPKAEKAEPEPVVEHDPNTTLLVDSLIDWGTDCTSLAELTSLWKANQGQIDTMKKTQKEEYSRLQSRFAHLKENFKEESL